MLNPQTEISVGGTLEIWEVLAVAAVVGAAIVMVLLPIARAWARRIEARASGTLAERVAELEAHVAELEARVEFTERILPRPGEQEGTPPRAG